MATPDRESQQPPPPPKPGNVPPPDSVPKLPQTIFNLEKKGEASPQDKAVRPNQTERR
jgi:hypothetical protein